MSGEKYGRLAVRDLRRLGWLLLGFSSLPQRIKNRGIGATRKFHREERKKNYEL